MMDQPTARQGDIGLHPRLEVTELADRYGLTFGQPDWLPELISRYGLRAPSDG